MGKNRHTEGETAVEADVDEKLHLQESKKEKKKQDKLKRKQERLEQRAGGSAPGSPAAQGAAGPSQEQQGGAAAAAFGPPDSLADAQLFLRSSGVALPEGAPRLRVEYSGGRKIEASSSVFSKQKAAHRFLQEEPLVTWDDVAEKDPCTLIMIDPDAPERNADGSQPGRHAPWLHWILTNAKGSSETGDVVCDYQTPAPPIGVHRYIFLLFKGAVPKQRFDNRISFDVGQWVREHSLGAPVAGNFFYCTATA